MNTSVQLKSAALFVMLLAMSLTQAQTTNPNLGRQLSTAELAKNANAPSVRLDGKVFRILNGVPVTGANSVALVSDRVTQVVNDQGVVGESRNEVIISEIAPNRVRDSIDRLKVAPVSVNYYEHIDLSTLRFSSFQDAVDAYDQLKKLLPQARVHVPVKYGKAMPR